MEHDADRYEQCGKDTLGEASCAGARRRAHLCRHEIEAQLGPELTRLGYSGIADVAEWMGLPHEPQSKKNQKRYLNLERSVMYGILKRLERGANKLVVDTTGSVIYTGISIRDCVRAGTTVVLLDTPKEQQDAMFQQFIAEPKPVIWGNGVYKPLDGETPEQTLARCYPELLAARSQMYRQWAHYTIAWSLHRNPKFTVQDFLRLIGLA